MKHLWQDRILCALLTLCLLVCTLPVTAVAESEVAPDDLNIRVDGWEEFPYAPAIPTWQYTYNKMTIYAEDEAPAGKAPAGYTGFVMELVGNAELGFLVDFTDMHIPLSVVKAIHFRVWYPADTKEVRAAKYDNTGWLMRHVAENPCTWEDVVLDDPAELNKIANKDGTLGRFGFGFRLYTVAPDHRAWVDCIEVELIPGDTEPPVLTYTGEATVDWTAGRPFSLNATAYDAFAKTAVPITYEWSDGALDEDGLPVEGVHAVRACAADCYGNRAELSLTVRVAPRDTEAPVIGFRAKTIRTYAGTFADSLIISAVDNTEGAVATVNMWSDGALDPIGRLQSGTHTLTVTATDTTGNQTTVVVTVVVE